MSWRSCVVLSCMVDVQGELPVDLVDLLRERRSAKWRTHSADVLPLTLAEMDFALAPAVAAALREAIDRSDTGYPVTAPQSGEAISGFAGADGPGMSIPRR